METEVRGDAHRFGTADFKEAFHVTARHDELDGNKRRCFAALLANAVDERFEERFCLVGVDEAEHALRWHVAVTNAGLNCHGPSGALSPALV